MGCNKAERAKEQQQKELTGYESAQRKRFLLSEKETKQEEAA